MRSNQTQKRGKGHKGKEGESLGILAIWNDIDPVVEADYHEWYFQQHLLERLSIPGFLSARRYEATGAGPKFFTFYHTQSIEVMRSPAYLERVNHPTDWTRRNMASFRGMNRTACRETIDLGRGVGSVAITLEIKAASGQEGNLRRQMSDSLFPDLLRSPGASGAIRARLWEGDPEITTQKTNEQALREEKDKSVDWVVVVEASSMAQAEKAAQGLAGYPFRAWGVESIAAPFVYRLLHYFPGSDGR
jgi:hypothetical protein